jgi:hypothetical protein
MMRRDDITAAARAGCSDSLRSSRNPKIAGSPPWAAKRETTSAGIVRVDVNRARAPVMHQMQLKFQFNGKAIINLWMASNDAIAGSFRNFSR